MLERILAAITRKYKKYYQHYHWRQLRIELYYLFVFYN